MEINILGSLAINIYFAFLKSICETNPGFLRIFTDLIRMYELYEFLQRIAFMISSDKLMQVSV